MADKLPKVGDDLGDGWSVTHVAPAKSVQTSGSGSAVISVTEASIIAHKRVGDTLTEQHGSSVEELKDRIEQWNGYQTGPNPLREDGNRELSVEETMDSARGTAIMQVTEGARVGRMVDLTPAQAKAKPKAAIIHAKPPITEEKLSGEQAASVAAAVQGVEAPESSPPKSSGKSSSSK